MNYDVIILGSGPGGYVTAIRSSQLGLKTAIIEKENLGGICLNWGCIPTKALLKSAQVFEYINHAEDFGITVKDVNADFSNIIKRSRDVADGMSNGIAYLLKKNKVEVINGYGKIKKGNKVSVTVDGKSTDYSTKHIIIATGASANRLGVINEDKFWSKGISACAICDGATPQFRDEELAVIGGGDSACEEAAYLTKYGSKVHLIVRSEKLRASAAMVDRVKANPKIEIHWNTKVDKADGTEWLERIETIHSQEGKGEINIKGLFYAIGHTPNTKFLGNKIDLDNKGYIACKSGRPETSIEGIFAAGDVVDSEWRQGVTAAGTGCMAALATERWLAEKNLAKTIVRETPEPEKKLNSSDFNEEEVNEDTFDSNSEWQKGSYALRKLYHESKKPILVIFSSPSCGPCHVLKPQLKRVIKELDGAVLGVEIDIDKDQDIAKQAGISGTPTVQLFKEKLLKKQWQGVKQRSEFKEAIKNII